MKVCLYLKSMLAILGVFLSGCHQNVHENDELTCNDIERIRNNTDEFELHSQGYQELKGKLIPNVKLQSVDGSIIHVYDMKKDAYLLDFWFIGCAPCEVEMPYIIDLEQRFENVGIISIARNTSEELYNYFNTRPIYKNLFTSDSVYEDFCVDSYPTKFIVNSDFVIQNMYIGGSMDKEQTQIHITKLEGELMSIVKHENLGSVN